MDDELSEYEEAAADAYAEWEYQQLRDAEAARAQQERPRFGPTGWAWRDGDG